MTKKYNCVICSWEWQAEQQSSIDCPRCGYTLSTPSWDEDHSEDWKSKPDEGD